MDIPDTLAQITPYSKTLIRPSQFSIVDLNTSQGTTWAHFKGWHFKRKLTCPSSECARCDLNTRALGRGHRPSAERACPPALHRQRAHAAPPPP